MLQKVQNGAIRFIKGIIRISQELQAFLLAIIQKCVVKSCE